MIDGPFTLSPTEGELDTAMSGFSGIGSRTLPTLEGTPQPEGSIQSSQFEHDVYNPMFTAQKRLVSSLDSQILTYERNCRRTNSVPRPTTAYVAALSKTNQ